MNIVIIDNYDSFTYNLSHLVKKELGATVTVVRNDRFEMDELGKYDRILLSPDWGVLEEAGKLLDVIRTYAGKKADPRSVSWRTGYRRSIRRQAHQPKERLSRHTKPHLDRSRRPYFCGTPP